MSQYPTTMVEQMIKMKEERGYSYQEIGDKFGLCRMAVYKILKKHKKRENLLKD